MTGPIRIGVRLEEDFSSILRGLGRVSAQWQTLGSVTNTVAVTQAGAASQLIRTTAAVGGLAVALAGTAGLAFLVGKSIGAFLELDTELRNVQRVTGFSSGAISKLRDGFLELQTEIPISAIELSKAAAAIGKLGIVAKNNAAGLLDLTKAASSMAVVLGVDVEYAATTLARTAFLLGIELDKLDDKGVSFSRKLASAMIAAEQSTTASFDSMSRALNRLAGPLGQFHVDPQFAIGIAAAIADAGATADVGATAITRLLGQMAKVPEKFAKTVGKSVGTFKKELVSNAQGTIEDFLKQLEHLDPIKATELLGDLNQASVRSLATTTGLARIFERIFGSGGIMDKVNAAYKDDAELTKQLTLITGSFSSILQVLGNDLNTIANKISSRLGPVFRTFASIISDTFGFFSRLPDTFFSAVGTMLTLVTVGAIVVTTLIAISKANQLLGFAIVNTTNYTKQQISSFGLLQRVSILVSETLLVPFRGALISAAVTLGGLSATTAKAYTNMQLFKVALFGTGTAANSLSARFGLMTTALLSQAFWVRVLKLGWMGLKNALFAAARGIKAFLLAAAPIFLISLALEGIFYLIDKIFGISEDQANKEEEINQKLRERQDRLGALSKANADLVNFARRQAAIGSRISSEALHFVAQDDTTRMTTAQPDVVQTARGQIRIDTSDIDNINKRRFELSQKSDKASLDERVSIEREKFKIDEMLYRQKLVDPKIDLNNGITINVGPDVANKIIQRRTVGQGVKGSSVINTLNK